MAIELTMPKNDMDMEEGTIVKWLKNVGDKVEKGEMFMEIETDKTSMEIESPATGVLLAQFYQGGDVVPVNTVMGYVGEAGEAVPEQGAKAAAEEAPKEEKKEASAAEKAPAKVLSDASGIPATPYAKKLAKDNGIDLKEVVPTGRHGEIRAIDVFTAIEASPVATPLAKAMAADLGVDLSTIQGSGYRGKILSDDIKAAFAQAQTAAEEENVAGATKEIGRAHV